MPDIHMRKLLGNEKMLPNMAQWSTDQSDHNTITPQWLSSFADPGLSALVQDAHNNNYDLKSAAARVAAAREQSRIDCARRWPQMSFAQGYRRTARQAYSKHCLQWVGKSMSGAGSGLRNRRPARKRRPSPPIIKAQDCRLRRAVLRAII